MTIDDLLAPLEAERAERLDPLDYPGDWTDRQKKAYTEHTLLLDQQIVYIRSAASRLASAERSAAHIDAQIASLTTWREQLNAWRSVLCAELMAGPQRVRTRAEMDQLADLQLSLVSIDRGLQSLMKTFGSVEAYSLRSTRLGTLMVESGYTPQPENEALRVFGFLPWRGSLKETDAELAVLEKQRQAAAFDLAVARRDHDALLAAPV